MTDTALTTQKHPIVILRERLEARRDELKAALIDVTPEAFIRALITSAQLNPDILACQWPSIWNACMKACRDGLLPDGQEGAIVPFRDQATWIPMYQGLLRRFRRSGTFKWITAGIVRQGEEFDHVIDENGEHFRHKPGDKFDAPIQKIYALATTREGGVFVTVMPIDEANKIKNMSKATREDAPWKLWPEEMLKKTALRRLSKLLPTARDLLPTSEDDQPFAFEIPSTAKIPLRAAEPGNANAAVIETLDQFAAEQQQATINDAQQTAYKAGVAAKAAGIQRRAMPGEYRDKNKQVEADAWLAGWDGVELKLVVT